MTKEAVGRPERCLTTKNGLRKTEAGAEAKSVVRPGSFELVSKIARPYLGFARDGEYFLRSLVFLVLLEQAKSTGNI